MIEDSQLLEYYLWGFCDEIEELEKAVLPSDVLIHKAYNLGRSHGKTNNEYISNQQIIHLIRYV